MTPIGALHARHFESGARRVLALHCMLAHGEVWRPVAEHLPSVSVTAPDFPSHGMSPDWDGDMDFHDTCLAAVVPFLDDQAIDIVGHSFGGTIALRLAVEHPERVRSLTLIEPVYFAVLKQSAPRILEDHLVAAQPYADAIASGDYETGVQRFTSMWGAGVPWESMTLAARQYLIDRTHLVPAQYPAIFEDRQSVLSQERLARVNMPVLLVRGDQSLDVTAHINSALAEHLPNARQTTIEGAGHMAPITHAAETAAVIADSLDVT